MKKRLFLRTLTLGALALTAAGASLAQTTAATYPNRPIRIVVPFAAGGTSDVLARSIGQKLGTAWGQSVIVENRPGADGNLGAEVVARAAPDGYTLLIVDISTLTVSPLVMARMTYDPLQDLAPVTMVSFSPHALAVTAALPATNLKELLAYSKAHPGKLNFAAGNQATKLAALQLKTMSGIDMTSVPYKGGAAALNALISGEVDVTLVGLLASMPQMAGGRIRAIAVSSAQRMPATKDIPTVAESGLPGYVSGSWQGILAPRGTPKDVVAKLNAALAGILNDAAFKAHLAEQGTEVIADQPEQFGAFLLKDAANWKKIATAANIKPE
ncbi:MAG: tripartite tricarboxylate transporter substrate binding protein [Rhodoferax sp.]|nr:tripartite tricarboxylate transporter substrate binding protein [Rhodoferax sp.]